jgi:excisionase family DNA binding protein
METSRISFTNQYLTIADIKCYLNISQSAAYELTHRKDFPVCRFGSSIRIPRDAFLAWVESRTYIPTALVSTRIGM